MSYTEEQLKELLRMVPPHQLEEVHTQNLLTQVYFRAGLLAAREFFAAEVDRVNVPLTAENIRNEWFDFLGADPGPPRKYAFDELVEEVIAEDGTITYVTKDISPSVEALAIALQFLQQIQTP